MHRIAHGAVMVQLTVAAYGAVMIGLTWVTIAETASSARRLLEPSHKARGIPPLGGPIQTL
ncbi:MAG: hypothetical protein QF393_08285 [Rhodospirillales bacterium]|nr:hypothetical protein [Rhodospirillales bacterium]